MRRIFSFLTEAQSLLLNSSSDKIKLTLVIEFSSRQIGPQAALESEVGVIYAVRAIRIGKKSSVDSVFKFKVSDGLISNLSKPCLLLSLVVFAASS